MNLVYSIFLFYIFLITPLSLLTRYNMQLSQYENIVIKANSEAKYICLDENMSDIKNLIFEISKFDKDRMSPLHIFKRYLRKGFNIGLYDEVMHVLEYAELVVQKKALEVGYSKMKPFIKRMNNIINQIRNKELTYNPKNNTQESKN